MMTRDRIRILLSGIAFLTLWLSYIGGCRWRGSGLSTLRGHSLTGIRFGANDTINLTRRQQSGQSGILVLHVGPPDTNAETIQQFAATHEEDLQKDNFYYIEDDFFNDLYQVCYMIPHSMDGNCTKQWQQFGETLEFHRKRRHNVLVSNEWLGAFYNQKEAQNHLWSNLKPLVENWDVRVVYTYRRYHEWLPNHYLRMVKAKVKPREKWPDQGGQELSSFPEEFDRVTSMTYMQPPSLLKQWKLRFTNVSIWNTHAPGDVIGSFFCNSIPEATHICSTFSKANNGSVHRNFTDDLQFDRLAVAAYEKGLVNPTLSRQYVADAAEHYGEVLRYKRKQDYPLQCLSKDKMDNFLNMSLSMERAMLPQFYASEYGKETLESHFSKGFAKNRLPCSFDVEAILSDTRWESFFSNLGQQDLPWDLAKKASGSNETEYPIDYPDLDVNLSFLGIGAQGAGTTWLADMFRLCCPRIDFGRKKELHFWDWHRFEGLKWYSEQFRNRHEEQVPSLLHGEITPHYLGLPDEDIREIRLLFPDVPIFFLARDLVDRAWSHVRKNLRRDEEKGRLSTSDPSKYSDKYFMDIIYDPSHEERSNYEAGLRRWYNHFPDEQILILNFDDIRNDPVGFVLKVLNHIGLSERDANVTVLQELAAEPVNTGQHSILRPSLRKKLEDLYRPYSRAFNGLLQEKGYKWRLDDYPEINPNVTKQNKVDDR